jgi:Mrp family chromosome partitioning ATPase
VIAEPAESAGALREALAAALEPARSVHRGFARPPEETLQVPSMDGDYVDRCRIALGKLAGLRDEGVVAISSPRRRDGRSSVALALALALARTRAGRVLLVDADLERPRLADLFSIAPVPGLADYLEGREPLRLVSGGPGRRLWLLPAGQRLGDSSRLINVLGRAGMLEALRERFQWVVMDLPPMLPDPEVAVLASRAEWHILVGRYRHSTIEELRKVHEMVSGDQRVGFLLTGDASRIPGWLRRLL